MAFFYALSPFNFMGTLPACGGRFPIPLSRGDRPYLHNLHKRGPPKEKETLSGRFFFLVFFVVLCAGSFHKGSMLTLKERDHE